MRRVLGVAAAIVTAWAGDQSFAQNISSVPDNAIVVVKVKNLQETSGKLGKLFQNWGLVEMSPMFGDPLASFQGVTNIQEGLNRDGEAAFYMVNPAGQMQDGDPYVILLPVSDFKAFLGNFPDAQTDGEITSITMPGEEQETGFVTQWGNHAAISPSRSLISARPRSTKAAGLTGDQFAQRDVVAYLNFNGFRNQAVGMIGFARMGVGGQLDQAAQQDPSKAKYIPLAKVAVNQIINGVEHFLNETEAITFGLDLSDSGIQLVEMCEFKPDTYLGGYAKAWNVPAGSLTAGLPAGQHALVGGSASDPETLQKLMNDMLTPIETEAKRLGADGKLILDYLQATRDFYAAAPVQSFSITPSKGEVGAGPIFDMAMVIHGDSKKVLSSWNAMAASQDEFMKMLQGGQQPPTAIEVQKAALTVDGVTFDKALNKITAPPGDPQVQMLQKLYGPEGMTMFIGSVADDKVVISSRPEQAALSEVIAAARSGADPVSQQAFTKEVQAKLPKNPTFAMYAHGDQILALASRASEAFAGTPLQMKLANAQPFGMSVATEGTAVRMDMFVPSDLVKAVVQAVMSEGMPPQPEQ